MLSFSSAANGSIMGSPQQGLSQLSTSAASTSRTSWRPRSPPLPPSVHVALARRFAYSGVRLTVTGPTTPAALRAALAASSLFSPDVAAWLRIRMSLQGPSEVGIAHAIADLVVGTEIRATSLRQLSYALRAAGLPSVAKWRSLGRVLAPIVALQSSDASITQTCAELGIHRQDLSRVCRRLFGSTPGRLRHILGWEELLHRFLSGMLAK